MATDKNGAHSHYDGIREENNRLPTWWVAGFIVTYIVGYTYWVYYHVAEAGPGSVEALRLAEAETARRAAEKKPLTNEILIGLSQDPATVGEGQSVFASNCVQCHGARGEGGIGPNLTDNAWIHGSTPLEIKKVVETGVQAKGMPPWKSILGASRVRAVVAYVLTLKGKNLAGKAPEGTVGEVTPGRR